MIHKVIKGSTRIILLISIFLLASGAINLFAQEIPKSGVVIRAVENMFSRASEDVDVVSQAIIGTKVKILKSEKDAKAEDWYLIETPDIYQGWMRASAVSILEPSQKPYASESGVFEVESLIAHIYQVADATEKKPLAVAPIGAILEIGECGERCCAVILPSGDKGWIQKGDGSLRDAEVQMTKSGLIEVASGKEQAGDLVFFGARRGRA